MILIESNGSTLRVLCVSCSILVFTHFSHTRPIPFLTIHKIFPIVLVTLSVEVIAGAIRGTFGAGGSVGRLSSMLGINDGSSGSLGGDGICGILGRFTLYHIVKSIFAVGGAGNVGSAGRGMLFGTNCTFGKRTSIPRRILLRST